MRIPQQVATVVAPGNDKRPRTARRISHFLAALCTALFLGTTVAAPPAEARSITFNLDIPSQSLSDALQALAAASQYKLLYSSELVDGKSSPAIKGQFTTEQAVKALLSGSNLAYEVTADGLVLIRAAGQVSSPGTAATLAVDDSPFAQAVSTREASGDSSFWSRFRLAQGDQGLNRNDAAANAAGESTQGGSRTGLEEVVVTAQKRQERLLDVPVPVSVISGTDLRDTGKTQLADYFDQLPGLSYASGPGVSVVVIRGLNSGGLGFENPTVGFTVDEVPYGASKSRGGSWTLPEIDPGDLAQVEVLRGPQGTLYGASSLGGLIKYVTVTPSRDRLKGDISLGLNAVKNGADPGYSGYGAVNIPLGDVLAMRVSGYTRSSPGYFDNPVLGTDGIADRDIRGGRVAGLWEPSDSFSLKLTAFVEDTETHGRPYFVKPGSPYFGSGFGDLEQNDPPVDVVRETMQYGSAATMRLKLGNAELMSITGYNSIKVSELAWGGGGFSFFTESTEDIFGSAVPNNSTDYFLDGYQKITGLSQELRLSLPLTQRIDASLGLFYTDGHTDVYTEAQLRDRSTWQVAALRDISRIDYSFAEWASFANFTFRLTDQFDLQVGARYGGGDERSKGTRAGPSINGVPYGVPSLRPNLRSKDNVFTYQATPRYKFTEALMAYARIATGYRPGGFNGQDIGGLFIPPYDSDSSTNYEVGFKGSMLNGSLTMEASIYRIDWKDIQASIVPTGAINPHTVNGGAAKSQGVELSVSATPLDGLTLSGWVTLTDAKLTEDAPPGSTISAFKGDRLPLSGQVSSSLSATQDFPFWNATVGYVGGTVTYVDNRPGGFTAPDFFTGIIPPRSHTASYVTLQLTAGVRAELWTLGLYATNVTDKRAVTYDSVDEIFPIKPREIGLNLSRRF